MDINKLIENYKKIEPLSIEEINYLYKIIKPQKYKKNSYIFKEGENHHFIGYITKGIVRCFCSHENGTETTLHFGIEDWWVADINSFSNTLPSKLNLKTLEDTQILAINKLDYEKLLRKFPKFERIYRKMIEKHLFNTQNRLIKNITQNAEDKYKDFLEKYPNLSSRIPQRYIASYLGISPEFLSKTRKKLLSD